MKKICILQNDFVFGGTDTFVLNLSKGLIKDGYNVTVILSIDSQKKALRESELTDIGVRVLKTSSLQKSIYSKLKHLFLLYKILKKEKFDVFQTNIDLFNGPNLFVAWLARVPIRVCHSHNSMQGSELKNGLNFTIVLKQQIKRFLCWHFSNRRCGCSELAMDFLYNKKWKEDSNSKVVHNGIDFSEYLSDFSVEEKRKEFNFNKKYIVTTVGRISFQKNPLFLLEIVISLLNLRNDVEFVWLGTGELQDEVKSRLSNCEHKENIHLMGNRSDVSDFLRMSDCFLLPSLFEGLPIVLIEAQAANLPCVISNTITQESNCGSCLYLPITEQPEFWAEQISAILDKETDLSVDKSILANFAVENMVKQMEEIFE